MTKTSLHWLDYLIIIASLIVPFVVTLRFSKKQKDTNNYFIARGSVPTWVIGISILAALISSITFLAYPGEGFKSNWILLVQGLMVPIVLAFVIGFIVPLYRNVIKLSAYEYFEHRFGFFARIYTSVGFFLSHFSKMGTVFFLLALAMSKMTGLDTIPMIWIVGFIVIFITLLGGIEAVFWLDVFQGTLKVIGGITALMIIIFTIPGGVPTIWKIASAGNRTGFGPYKLDFVHLTFAVMVLNGIFYAIQKYGTDQTIVQRYLTATTDKEAKKASFIGVFLTVPVWGLFMFIGTALFAYYQVFSAELPANIKPDEVFPYFIMTKLPVGVIGLILSALLAAAISSLDADLNCLSAICLSDYYIRFKPQSTEKQRMFLSRAIIIIAGIAALLIATYYVYIGSEGILEVVFTLYSIFSGGIAGMFLLGLFSSRANKQGLYIGIAACVLFTAWAVLTSTKFDIGNGKHLLLDFGSYNYTHHKLMLGVYSHIVLFVVGYFASYFFKSNKEIEHLTWRGWKRSQKIVDINQNLTTT
jgi:solute:Na+ symporter, SSS family